jgi:hypothetical protein
MTTKTKEGVSVQKARKTARKLAGVIGKDQPAEDELNQTERDLLGEQETRIQTAQDSFFELVDALRIIEDHKLFRPHGSLSAYCKFRWDMSDSQVSHYRSAWVVLRALENAGFSRAELPRNEGQTRALARRPLTVRLGKEKDGAWKFDTKKAVSTWRKLVKAGKPITAQAIIDEAKGLKKGGESSESSEEGSPLNDLKVTAAKMVDLETGKAFIQVVVRASKEQADLLNALLGGKSTPTEKNGVYTLVGSASVETVMVGFGAFITEHQIKEGSISFVVK